MARAGAEVRERHPVAAADARVELVHLSGEAVGRKPFGHGVGVEEGAINLLGLRAKDAVKANGVVRHDQILLVRFLCWTACRRKNHRSAGIDPTYFARGRMVAFVAYCSIA